MKMFTRELRGIGRTHLQMQADQTLLKEKSTAFSDEGENACLIRVVRVCVSTFQACEKV